ncbi:MAG: cob(I)yrinic acid a,c-diamide adenosyltransferase [Gammaproteobacteria bacterium]|nr:cob(I)yrinic acid a,c-diamide adenosyltransferase [Gammaproteobacteria bacterium]
MNDHDDRHNARMQRQKEVVDRHIAEADIERGLLLVHTGNGKGKSSSAFGVLARALGHGMHAGVVQFVKSPGTTGEERFFSQQENVEYHATGDGFTWETQDREQDIATARAGWKIAKAMLSDETKELVILDELNIILKLDYLAVEEVLEALAERPGRQHVIVTGRGAPAALIEAADTVTEMRLIKHAYNAGIKAQPGVEY